MLKNKRGITLIALIVTIIILLILAGISIATLTQSGLFKNAKEAKEQYKNAQEQEAAILADYENQIVTLGSTRNLLPSQILYPDNGESKGSATTPATISASDRIVIDNPYPGHNLDLKVEVQFDGIWATVSFGNGFGILVSQYRNSTTDKIVIQAGNIKILGSNGDISGHPFGLVIDNSPTSYPFRIIVTCLD